MRGFGGMVSFRCRAASPRRRALHAATPALFSLAESLGGVETLIEHPAIDDARRRSPAPRSRSPTA